ncbi:MAG: hypothetical protein Q9173_000816 [Seirophora scorigena]
MSAQPSKPRPVPSSPPPSNSRGRSPAADSASRATSIARLALSPAASTGPAGTPAARHTSGQATLATHTPLAGAEGFASATGPGQSALAAALQGSFGSPPKYGTPPRYGTPSLPTAPANPPTTSTLPASGPQTAFGSFDARSSQGLPLRPQEDPEVVRRHLVQPQPSKSGNISGYHSPTQPGRKPSMHSLPDRRRQRSTIGEEDDTFSSLQLQGGDVTREVYRWTEGAESALHRGPRGQRSRSFHVPRPEPENDTLDIASIKVPGGFRRNYLRRQAPDCSGQGVDRSIGSTSHDTGTGPTPQSRFFTNNFIEFLTLYGHFAGEELEEIKEEDEEEESDDYASDSYEGGEYFDNAPESGNEPHHDETNALLAPATPGRRRRHQRRTSGRVSVGRNSPLGAASMLLKSFVGTGVLFLPKAYLNGGMLFSNVVLLFVAALSYYCFILLVNTRLKVEASFGDMGGILYGRWLRVLILTSVALSQIGFVSAYIVFTSENLQAFILAVSDCRTWIDIKFMVLMQLIIFLPLSLIRNISALSLTAYIADFFIMLGLIYLYYYDIRTILINHGIADIINFNPRDWSLFIGTAIFTFEGVGLIIPIQESMRQPSKFPPVLAAVMIIITVIFVSMGALSYAAFGSSTKTVVLLNLPQDDKFVNAVQFLYSLAILLSTPLQLFPAIRIMENAFFSRSGKNDLKIKLGKNVFRFVLVMVCALIAWGGAGDLDKFVAIIGPTSFQSGGPDKMAEGFRHLLVRIHLTTSQPDVVLPEKTGPILVNTNFRRYALSSLVNTILENEKPVPFDFLINGTFLRSSLDDYLTQHGLSSETTLHLEYVKAAIPPVHLASFEHEDWVSSVDFLSSTSIARASGNGSDAQKPGHEKILSASYDGLLRIWDMSSQVTASSPPAGDGGHVSSIKAAKFISSSQIASSGIDRTVRLWRYRDASDDSPAAIDPQIDLYGHNGSVDALAVHQSTSRILSASADHYVGLWSARKSDAPLAKQSCLPSRASRGTKRRKVGPSTSTPQCGPLALLKSHCAPVSSVIFAPNDPTVAYSVSWDHTLKTWDLPTATPVDTRSTSHSLLSLVALPTLNLVAAGTSARHVTLIDPRASAVSIVAMTLRGHTNAVVSLATDPNSTYGLASGSHDGTCRVWDLRSTKTEKEGRVGQSMYSIGRESPRGESRASGDEMKVFSIAWDSDIGIVSAGQDKRVQINRGNNIGPEALC